MPRAHSRQEEIPLAEPAPPWRAKGIFTDHIIKSKLPGSRLWPSMDVSEPIRAFCAEIWNRKSYALGKYLRESHTREELLNKVLARLGFAYLPDTALPTRDKAKVPDYVLYRDEATKAAVFESGFAQPFQTAIALLEAKKVNHHLDAVSKRDTPGRFPHQQVRDYLQYAGDLQTGKPFFNWAILTNGNLWRFYCRNATPDDYFEFNFEKSLESAEEFAVFVALFSPAALIPDSEGRCALDELRDDALQYQTKLEDDLRERVFNILEDIANGFYARPENHITEVHLGDLYQNCLILLYRLLFVLYAEGRGLLPVRAYGAGHNKHYCERFSLARLFPRLRDPTRFYNDDTFTKLNDELLDLFRLINGDETSLNRKCNVPQYNGGLFDSERYPMLRQWRVGERTLAEALRGLMFGRIPGRRGESSRFDFGETIDYAELEVRQLGTIYEGLLENHLELKDARLVLVGDKAERKATGTYYTPDFIVRYIVDHTLGPLCQRIEESADVQKAIKQGKKDNSFANAVLELKVLDLAMGSGHFLVRVTERLADKILDHPTTTIPVPEVSPGLSQAATVLAYWRRRVVERCIFGVDLNPLAVELAKLSLWLTCIATDQPLSFLDHHLRTGNSLIGARLSELGSLPRKTPAPELHIWTAPNLQTAVSHALAALSQIEETESKDIKALREKETRWTTDVLPKLAPYRKVADLWISTYFGLPLDDSKYAKLAEMLGADEKPRTKAAKALVRSTDEALEKLRRRYAFFHWELEFPEVFFNADGTPKDNPGFDVVVGNPPYVRQEKLMPEQQAYYKTHYQVYSGTGDLYTYFIERGVNLLRSDGYFAYIVSNKWLRANYGKPLRSWLRSQRLQEIVDFDDSPVFESITTYPCILRVARGEAETQFYVTNVNALKYGDLADYVAQHRHAVKQTGLGVDSWTLADTQTEALLHKLRTGTVSLGKYIGGRVYRGIITGLNDAFVIDRVTRDRLLSKDEGSAALVKPFSMGEDVKRYGAGAGDRFLILIPDGWTRRNMNSSGDAWKWFQSKHAAIAAHLAPFAERARKRWDKGEFWWELRPCEYYAEFEKPKIVFASIVRENSFTLEPDGFYSNDKTNIIASDSRHLLGLLNSRLLNWYIRHIASTKQGGYFECKPMYASQLPIPVIDPRDRAGSVRHDRMVALVERMLGLHKSLLEAWADSDKDAIKRDIETTDREIDALVYDLYGLSGDEIAIVEGRTK